MVKKRKSYNACKFVGNIFMHLKIIVLVHFLFFFWREGYDFLQYEKSRSRDYGYLVNPIYDKADIGMSYKV